MAKINKDNLSYLGFDFQNRLIAQTILDRKFSNSIVDIIDPNYFEDEYLKIIVATIKDAHENHEAVPDFGSLEARLLEHVSDDVKRKYAIANLRKIQEANQNDGIWVQETALKFCKQQELKKSVKQIQSIIDKGDFNDYDQCESILRKALEHGNSHDDSSNVTENIAEVLADDFRKPIPTGINGLDEIMDGGLSKGELAVILAAFGVGKTTMMTKLANTAKDAGYNVLQIFFEDNPKVIKRKHLACWSKIDLNSLSQHKEVLIELAEKKSKEKGVLKLKKFPSDGTTIPIIRKYILKLISQGFRPDIVLLDYIDCVQNSKKVDDAVNVGEGIIMRQFETMLSELDIAGWTAVQGNRSAIDAEIVQANQIGGSIKKGQIGHFIVSIAKTLDQKENGTATMAILKSRFGKDGVIFQNIIFDNARIQIDMGVDKIGRTNSEHKKDVAVQNQNRVNSVMEASKARRVSLGGPNETVSENNNNATAEV